MMQLLMCLCGTQVKALESPARAHEFNNCVECSKVRYDKLAVVLDYLNHLAFY